MKELFLKKQLLFLDDKKLFVLEPSLVRARFVERA
jgi:hypothetical protein